MQLVTRADMRAIEAAADAGGLPYADMMYLAGHSVAAAAEELLDGAPAIVVVLIGPGSNGGDGLVASLALADAGHIIRALVWRRDPGDGLLAEAAANGAIEILGADAPEATETLAGWLAEADLVVDALLGTGTDRPIDGDLAEILDTVSEAVDGEPDGPAVLAVDLPSGLDPDSGRIDPHTVPADVTVTFGFPKVGQFTWPGADAVGELQIDPIGISPELGRLADSGLAVATDEEMADLLPVLEPNAHKGSRGRVLVLGGSPGLVGAAALCAEAAYRSGCGLVTVALAERLQAAVTAWVPECTFYNLPDLYQLPADHPDIAAAADGLLAVAALSDAVVLGPGLSLGTGVAALLRRLLARWSELPVDPGPPPLLLDADALNLLVQDPSLLAALPAGAILTPHPGEMARLTGLTVEAVQTARAAEARALAERHAAVVVLKGALTVTATADGRATINPSVEPALATAGTGDVLAGVIGALLAQGLAPEEAATLAVWLHGRSGELAAEDLGPRSVMARDVLDSLPEAFQELEQDDMGLDDMLDDDDEDDEGPWG